MNKHYKSLIFTDHALDRLGDRSITQEMVYQAVTHSAKRYDDKDNTKFIRKLNNRKLHVVGQYLRQEKKWLIISVWVRGEDDNQPLVWRIITFPFWLLWVLLKWILKRLF